MEFPALELDTWDRDLHARLARLRGESPVHWDDGAKIWVLTRYDDVVTASKQPEIFCSGRGTRIHDIGFRNSIIDMDDPEHVQQRKIINRGFSPRMVAGWEHDFRKMTAETFDSLAGREEFDFVQEVSVPLPLRIIARMIGIEEERHADFHRWSDDMMAGGAASASEEQSVRAARAAMEYLAYIDEIVEARRRQPREDLVTALVNADHAGILGSEVARIEQPEGGVLEHSELQTFLILLLVAGNETTRNAISGGVAAFVENPDQYERLRRHPELMPRAVNEVVRYVSPVLNFARTATRDTVLGGQEIREGERVLLVYPAANRDPAVFENPDRFDVGRDPNPHVGFGIGRHYCLGANLARMELSVVFGELCRRYRKLEFVDEGPAIVPHDLVRTHVDMPVRVTPA